MQDERDVTASGIRDAWMYRDRTFVKEGYYTPAELSRMAERVGFSVDPILARVRRGTLISRGAELRGVTSVDGEGVVIGEGARLDSAVVAGREVRIGEGSVVSGVLEVSGLTTGRDNVIRGILGESRGRLLIGSANRIDGLTVRNSGCDPVIIGDNNHIYGGVSLNVPFAGARIWIGSGNHIGRDGGGVVSCSYSFSRGWSGDVVIGFGVETTRGAEVLGFSMIGVPLAWLLGMVSGGEEALAGLFRGGGLDSLQCLMKRAGEAPCTVAAAGRGADEGRTASVSLFGVVKTKRCCLLSGTRLKDGTQVQAAYIRGAELQEGSTVRRAALIGPADGRVIAPKPGMHIQDACLTEKTGWDQLGSVGPDDRYPDGDSDFFGRKL